MSCEYSYENVSTVYLGHDNTVTIIPYSDVVARTYYDMAAVTRVDASLDLIDSAAAGDDITASSSDVPTTVWWEQIGTTDEWRIHVKAGMFTSVVAGSFKMRIVIVEPTYPNGLVLTDSVLVDVVDVP